MENLLKYIGVYDFFARMLAGTIIIVMADLLDIISFVRGNNAISIWILIVLGYFTGVVIEEISFVFERYFGTRKKLSKQVCERNEYRKYDYKKCKQALVYNNKESVLDSSIAHIVMSSSLHIGSLVLLVIKLIILLSSLPKIIDVKHEILPLILLMILVILFGYRKRHYIIRRTEQVFDYCISMKYENIEAKV